MPAPARLEWISAAVAVGRPSHDQPAVAWGDLQALRRGLQPPEPWLQALECGALAPEPSLLAALWGRLDPLGVQRLLASAVGSDPQALLTAARAELPLLAAEPAVLEAWLQPLLAQQRGRPAAEAPLWLEMLGQFRHAAVAERLRAAIREAPLEPLLPLLGRQRDPADAALLQRLALEPGPVRQRRAALEGLALGLSAWPPQSLLTCLARLAQDLDPVLAAQAVDLLARLPQPEAQARLRALRTQPLDPAVRARLQRRLRSSPLLLVVHGRQGGQIPPELQQLAAELERRRGAPVRLQALTAAPPCGEASFWAAARRSGSFSLVPLLLLPGGHVRGDLPALAAAWRSAAAEASAISGNVAAPRLRRLPFLGAWPAWQQVLADALAAAVAEASAEHDGLQACWLHHPLEGPLAQRYLQRLAQVLRQPGLAAPYSAAAADLALPQGTPLLLLPLTLAANRLSESLQRSLAGGAASGAPASTLLPPLLEIPALRQFLLTALEALP